ncbi:MAG: ACP S-malonyltransferase [Acidimicrobiales bacterium]|mgnify:FL=1|jgi:[acyl-carrier-protein] S-malonyltransferase|nr:ACP S-malonyltransferase [Acidimicrobiales bacterium]MDP6284785.1 ACP S-malonyltransferase [Acidimicrobiales bacterium]HJL91133.1 ACP S-malonyltransferase [Acidimicrobiales bacterium]HJO41123.1 ACP S-malonyltransferase [Acidimicrobiales bacterium]
MIVFTYPGQGSQFSGMGSSWLNHPSWELIEEASDATHIDISDLLINATDESLRETQNAQLSTFVLSMLVLDAVERIGLDSTGHAGHSLGEYSALTASGALDFFDSVRLVKIRGKAMKNAIEENPGTMSAVLGLSDGDVEELCNEIDSDVWVANYNSPGQLVIAGNNSAIEEASDLARKMGAKKVTQLSVAGAFHTPLMSSARAELSEAIENTDIRPPSGVVVANVDGMAHENPETWRALMSAQLCSPVRWTQTIETLLKMNFSTFIEIGPGKVLTGLTKRVEPNTQRLNINEPSDLDQLLDLIAPTSSTDGSGVSHEGEHLFSTDRLVVSPSAGMFKPISNLEIGEKVSNGQLLGHVGTVEIHSPFSGELMGWIAVTEERLTASQPVAWLRVT